MNIDRHISRLAWGLFVLCFIVITATAVAVSLYAIFNLGMWALAIPLVIALIYLLGCTGDLWRS